VSLLGELKRRNVIRVGLAYVVGGWLLAQVTEFATDAFEAPGWVLKLVTTFIVVGLVPALIFAWVFELTPEGLKRESEVDRGDSITAETGHKLNVVVIVLLVVALGVFVGERALFDDDERPAESVDTVRATSEQAAPATAANPQPIPAEVMPADVMPAARDASVAVLPFTTRSMDEADQFFSDGVHDDLLTQLAKIGSLKVISRTSVMEYRDTIKRIPDIAAELGVATVVEGAVQRSGDMVRITAQLIDAQTDEHLWAESYDRELTARNLFAIQTEIATSIAGALKATLSPEEQAALERQLTDNREALEAYWRAGWLLDASTDDNATRVEEALRRAIDLDPRFAAAWARLAYTHMSQYWWRGQTEARRQQAWEALQRAKALDPDLPEVYAAEGYYYYWGFLDYERALAVLEPALAASPNDSGLHEVTAFVHRRAGNFDEAVSHLKKAVELDPRDAGLVVELADTLRRLGDFDQLEFYLGRLQALEPNGYRQAKVAADLAAHRDGNFAEAIRLLEPFADDAGAWLAVYQRDGGDFEGALATVDRLGDVEYVLGSHVWTRDVAKGRILWESGEREAARPYLERGLARLKVLAAESTRPGATLATECRVRAALGDLDGVREVCERALTEPLADALEFVAIRRSVAESYAAVGLHDAAFELLTEVMKSRVAPSGSRLLGNRWLGSLHGDPRWEKLIAEARP
jgi:TolB-like protein/cytochrome c-type biogenesis protein CcmH/NrfG